MMTVASLTVFFPCHNEEDNVVPLTEEAHATLSALAQAGKISDFEILIINDGSRDGTRELADALGQRFAEVRPIHHEVNQGYGGAVKTGLTSAGKDLVFFTDGDRQFRLDALETFVDTLTANPELDAVLGYRIKRNDPPHRLLFAKSWGVLVRTLFGMPGPRDIDCAFKMFRRPIIQDLQLEAGGALLTTELLAKLQKRGYRFTEVGVHHYPRPAGQQSGGSIKVIARAFKELGKLCWRIRNWQPPAKR